MKQLLLLAAGLLGLCTLGLTPAKAGPDDYYDRGGGDYNYRRPVYHERCEDGYGYRPQRRVVIVREYERPRYDYDDDCRPHYRRRHHHINFFLPLPPPPF